LANIHKQGRARLTSLADFVHHLGDLDMPAETARKLLKAHHGEWSKPMTLEESIEIDRQIIAGLIQVQDQ